jgi:hypothetical protein
MAKATSNVENSLGYLWRLEFFRLHPEAEAVPSFRQGRGTSNQNRHRNASLLAESLEVIQQTSAVIPESLLADIAGSVRGAIFLTIAYELSRHKSDHRPQHKRSAEVG